MSSGMPRDMYSVDEMHVDLPLESPPPSSPSTPGAPGQDPKKKHKRNYQACESCRNRKVKCEKGDVDNPNSGACARCNRESRQCFRAPERRKTKKGVPTSPRSSAGDSMMSQQRPFPHMPPGFIIRPEDGQAPMSPRPMTPGQYSSSLARAHGVATPHPLGSPVVDQKVFMSQGEFSGPTFDGVSAMKQLIKAANYLDSPAPKSRHDVTAPSKEDLNDALDVWGRMKMVRSGQFTAQEGIDYVQYFYREMLPLTPIELPDHSHVSTHRKLLEQEPFLLLAILTISSRWMSLEGDAGRYSRPSSIHDFLWSKVRRTIDSIMLGREQFGGGLCGAGDPSVVASPSLPIYGLRSISTVSALLLLTEWLPRGLHFPDGDDDGQLLIPDYSYKTPQALSNDDRLLIGNGGERRESWLEPTSRSDVMIWHFLNLAQTIAFEIGIFDCRSETDLRAEAPWAPELEAHDYHVRKLRLKEVFWTFYAQAAGRLELTIRMPPHYLEAVHRPAADVRIQNTVQSKIDVLEGRNARRTNPMPLWSDDPKGPENFFWQEIAALMKSGNEVMFKDDAWRHELISTGRYRDYIEIYNPLLKEWLNSFNSCTEIVEPMRSILLIEYEYARIYLHSFPLQAFVERAVANTPSKQHFGVSPHGVHHKASPYRAGPGVVNPEVVRDWMQQDYPFIKQLVHGCQSVLSLVGEGRISPNHLRHLPVRTYFRVMIAAVFLLKQYDFIYDKHVTNGVLPKSFAVGAYADDVRRSMDLLHKTSNALQENIVDDVHVGNRFAVMIKTVSEQMLDRLVKFLPLASATGYASHHQDSNISAAHSSSTGSTNGHHPNGPSADSWSNHQFHGAVPQFRDPANGLEFDNDGYNFDNIELFNPNNTVAMAPPGYSSGGPVGDFIDGSGFPINQEWYALDIRGLTDLASGQDNAAVSSGLYGPTINGLDILDQIRFPHLPSGPMPPPDQPSHYTWSQN